MIGREMGSMVVENDLIQVIETEHKDTVDELRDFIALTGPDWKSFPKGAVIVAEWWAMVENEPVAYACLTERSDLETVHFFTIVRPDRRNYGIGKFMVRCATDQAIRHRKRVIIVFAEDWYQHRHLLEDEEFEPEADSSMLRKELKWQ